MKASSKVLLAVCVSLIMSSCAMFKSVDKVPPKPTATAKGPDKGDPNLRFGAALDLSRKNKVAEAEVAFAALTKDFPEFSGPWTNLGVIYAKSNRREQALAALTKANTLNPANVVALDWLGILYRQTGDLPRARQAYEKALQLKPDNALAHYNLAILLDVYLAKPREALPHYKEYQRLNGGPGSKGPDLKVMAWIAEIEAQTPPPPAPSTGLLPTRVEQQPEATP
jgi:tetratricopeptide (TPR) repeat protein